MFENVKSYKPTYEEIYLTEIHNSNSKNKLDLHTYFYYNDLESCPICNEWLIQRTSIWRFEE